MRKMIRKSFSLHKRFFLSAIKFAYMRRMKCVCVCATAFDRINENIVSIPDPPHAATAVEPIHIFTTSGRN